MNNSKFGFFYHTFYGGEADASNFSEQKPRGTPTQDPHHISHHLFGSDLGTMPDARVIAILQLLDEIAT